MAHMAKLVVVFGFAIALSAAQDQRLIVTPTDEIQTRPEGGRLLLSCQAVNLNPQARPDLKWHDPWGNEIIDLTGRRYIERDMSDLLTLKLYIESIQTKDAGRYVCSGVIEGNRVEDSVTLEIFKDITFDDAPTPQHPVLGTDGLVICRVSGQPSPTISWRFRGATIRGGRYDYQQNGLRIMNISEADNGIYTCRAEVLAEGRLNSRSLEVSVIIPPKITRGVGQADGVERAEATISCAASGKPPPKYEFYKDNNQAPMRSTERIIVDADAGAIHFRPLDRADDGNYMCKAYNDAGTAQDQGFLDVIIPPRVTELLNKTQLEGRSEKLLCMMEGDPAPLMTWRKVGNTFDYQTGPNENGRITVKQLAPGQLELDINNLRPEDTSNYTCSAENTGGIYRQNGTITVQFRPSFAPDHKRMTYSWAGKTRNITCHALGEPEPLLDFYQYGKLLQNNETYRLFKMGRNAALQVKVREEDQGWIYGFYECKARNEHGEGVIELQLKRATVPDAPVSVSKKESSPTTLVLTVVPPENNGGVAVYGYRIEYDYKVQDFEIGETILIENLKPITTYLFRVRAKNDVGVSNAKDFTMTTDEVSKPFPIVIISDPIGQYPYSYALKWEKPRTGGIPIVDYEFRYRRVEVRPGTNIPEKPLDDWTRRVVDDDANRPALFYELKGLRPNTHYQVEVRARNELGYSLPNPTFAFRTADASGVGNPDEIRGNRAVTIRTSMALSVLVTSLLAFLVH